MSAERPAETSLVGQIDRQYEEHLRCPDCGSTNTDCTVTVRTHTHRCGTCGYSQTWKRQA